MEHKSERACCLIAMQGVAMEEKQRFFSKKMHPAEGGGREAFLTRFRIFLPFVFYKLQTSWQF